MIFNSIEFFIFLPLVFSIFWVFAKRGVKTQNFILLVASYVFYGWWDYRFLSLIVLSTLVDYVVGRKIYASQDRSHQKKWLTLSLVFNLGLLGFFKYFDFFVHSFITAFSFAGAKMEHQWTLDIVLPVGISFYTFQTLSYSLDIYRERLKPSENFISFATYVAFFPQLVAGPIERASQLLPQIDGDKKFKYDQAVQGLKLMLWGLFKKIVIADALAPIVDDIFQHADSYPSTTLALGGILFGFQIYGDFSGYSDIAIGTAKLFGIELMSNFKFPYFSRSIAEFWRRWHISLSTWFRDYLYIPLGGSKAGRTKAVQNIFIIFLVSGLWHGANWTFVIWGLFHAILFLPLFYLNLNRNFLETPNLFSSVRTFFVEGTQILWTFILVTIGWIFFRSETLSNALLYLKRMLFDFSHSEYHHPNGYRMLDYYLLLVGFSIFEYIIRADERNPIGFKNRYVRFLVYLILIFIMALFYDDGVDRSFIYFQF
ncbi:MBOAT family O-acyltransferase [Flagellimonas aequoris]|uniref:MBOAT family protein n=1 Tax=Flagellimonas aequoris TaxID=2306997 RepID=A0A418ND93_9FLAO|nr:MBOAT family O-acyltransferase [Allomuricauda aequoris]RIV74402.1 MBOAT family protein [Allomuricauda aequoris]TXK08524.1 MBOAT family protein [Allomuricauda aequoris]